MVYMANLDDMDYEELIELRDAVLQEISDRKFMRHAEAEANAIAMKWHQAKSRNLAEGEVAEWVQPVGAHDSYPFQWRVTHNGQVWSSVMAGNVWEPGVSGWRPVPAEGERSPWIQPTGAHDAYSKGDIVAHIDKEWKSLVDGNVWEPPNQWEEIVEPELPPVEEPPIEEPVDPEEPEEPIDPDDPVDPEDPPVDPEDPEEPPVDPEDPPIDPEDPPVEPEDPEDPPVDPEDPPVEPDPEPSYPVWVPWDHISPLYQIGDRVTHKGRSWEATDGNNHWEPGVYGWKDIGPA